MAIAFVKKTKGRGGNFAATSFRLRIDLLATDETRIEHGREKTATANGR